MSSTKSSPTQVESLFGVPSRQDSRGSRVRELLEDCRLNWVMHASPVYPESARVWRCIKRLLLLDLGLDIITRKRTATRRMTKGRPREQWRVWSSADPGLKILPNPLIVTTSDLRQTGYRCPGCALPCAVNLAEIRLISDSAIKVVSTTAST